MTMGEALSIFKGKVFTMVKSVGEKSSTFNELFGDNIVFPTVLSMIVRP